jgi:hypothetical protein
MRARVKQPEEMRMGSAQYGRLVLDGEVISAPLSVAAESLLWSADGRWLAARELVSWSDAPVTRVVVFDTERRTRIAASRPRKGLSSPVKFERGSLVCSHWDERTGDREMRLKIDGD